MAMMIPTMPMPESQTADWRVHYPFSSHYLMLDGHRYHYVDEGPSDHGTETLLLVHGNPTWSFHWRELIASWRDRYRVVVPDHLGCGLSDKPRRWSYRLGDHVNNLVRLVDGLELDNVTLVAHDWGGAIGLGAALARSERFARIVLLNTGAFPPWFIPWRIRVCRTPLVGRLAVQGFNLFARAALRMAMVHPDRLSPSVRAGYLAPYDTWEHRQAIYRFVQDIPLSPRHPSYATLANIETGLAQLAGRPIQIVWGMQDWCFTPACLEKFIELLPDAEVHRLEDAGHWVVEDAPATVMGLIEQFLDAHPVAGAETSLREAGG